MSAQQACCDRKADIEYAGLVITNNEASFINRVIPSIS